MLDYDMRQYAVRALFVVVVLISVLNRAEADDRMRSARVTAPLLSIGMTAGMLGVAELIGTDAAGPRGWTANAVGITGLLVGPSAGDFYLGNDERAVKLTTVRAAGFASVVGGLLLVDQSGDDAHFGSGLALIAVGGTAYCVATGYSLAAKPKRMLQPSISVMPVRTNEVVGLNVTGTF